MYSDKSINEEELNQSLPELPTSDEQSRQIVLDPPVPTRRDLPPITLVSDGQRSSAPCLLVRMNLCRCRLCEQH
jgi:hypothetical protein